MVCRNKKSLLVIVVVSMCVMWMVFGQSSLLAQQPPNEGHCGTQVGGKGEDAFVNYDEMVQELNRIERVSGGRVNVQVIGQSNRGKEMYAARVGNGDRVILVTSELHGNEKIGTEVILNILRDLGKDTAEVQALREKITLVAVPMANPDGSDLNRRLVDKTWDEVIGEHPQLAQAEPVWYYDDRSTNRQGVDYTKRPGFDLNRDFNPDLNYVPDPSDFPGSVDQPGFYMTSEAQAIRDVYKNLKEEFGQVDAYVDLHHQGSCPKNEETEQPTAFGLDYPPLPEENYRDYPLNIDFGKQLAVAAFDKVKATYPDSSPLSAVDQYLHPPTKDQPGQARSAFALNGSGTVLFEIRGQTWNYGPKHKGMLAKSVQTGLEGIIEGLADGSVYEITPERFDEDIPKSTR